MEVVAAVSFSVSQGSRSRTLFDSLPTVAVWRRAFSDKLTEGGWFWTISVH